MKTLDEFIAGATRTTQSEYVLEPGFDNLYVRYGMHYINGVKVSPVLTIANVTATRRSSGAFTGLLLRLSKRYPAVHVLVECVHNVRLRTYLARSGFVRILSVEHNYFLRRM